MDDPWEGVEQERRDMAKSVFAAAKQIAEEDGDGDFPLDDRSPTLRAVGGGFNRLVSRAAKGELDENDPRDMVDALRVVSAAMVDQRQPEQYRGFGWMNGGQPLVASPQTEGIARSHDYFEAERRKLFDRMKAGDRKAIDEFEVLHNEYMQFLERGDKAPQNGHNGGGWGLGEEDQQRLMEMGYDPQTGERMTGTTTVPKNIPVPEASPVPPPADFAPPVLRQRSVPTVPIVPEELRNRSTGPF